MRKSQEETLREMPVESYFPIVKPIISGRESIIGRDTIIVLYIGYNLGYTGRESIIGRDTIIVLYIGRDSRYYNCTISGRESIMLYCILGETLGSLRFWGSTINTLYKSIHPETVFGNSVTP